MKYIPVLFGLSLLGACGFDSDGSEAKRAAENYGFTNVVITGRRWFGCGRDDAYRVGFQATNAQGKRVSGVVCGGLILKAYTVRLD